MASNLTEYISTLQDLTQKNVNILTAINDAFYTKQSHLTVNVDDVTSYTIPSFIALENKLNSLCADFENLVTAPKTGEANFYFDGNSQSIQLKGYANTPEKVKLEKVTNFFVNSNDIFKDFLTPEPYIRLYVGDISNDINHINVKKIIPKNDTLIALLSSNKAEYKEVVKVLELYTEDIDYVEYDTLKHMPLKQNIGTGTYTITEVVSNYTDANFDEYYVLRVDNINYFVDNETIQKTLSVGDELVSYNDKVKLKITSLNVGAKTITCRVMQGAYINLVANDTNSNIEKDLCTLKYLSSQNLRDVEKYVDVPLEEDRYVMIFVAPVNSQMMLQAPWGTGIFLDVNELSYSDESGTYYFRDYYNKHVTNIGDSLYSLTSLIKSNIHDFGKAEFDIITQDKPVVNPDNLIVTEINAHLNNSKTVQKIRSLYTQKQNYKIELESVQKDIDSINNILASLSFQDTSNNRTIYTAQLTQLNEKKQELTTSISSILQEISNTVNETNIPIENAKYRIRGFFDYEAYVSDLRKKSTQLENADLNVNKIIVQYRYKNQDRVVGNAMTIGDKFIFSDWNVMDSQTIKMVPNYNTSSYQFNYPKSNNDVNEPSFNQIDIPISQGESVDIRLKVVYDLGYPYIETTSAWSDIVNIEFPQEFLKNVSILDIIEENNDDIKKNQFNGILTSGGYTKHVDDLIVDQDVTYFHHPEYISSGFYTAERRIIPLKDKLEELNSDVLELKDEVFGTSADDLHVTIVDGNTETQVLPFSDNTHYVLNYTDAKNDNNSNAVANLSIKLANKSDHNVKLFSIFPGNLNEVITPTSRGRYTTSDYSTSSLNVYIKTHQRDSSNKMVTQHTPQYYNQYLYFRVVDIYNNEFYYASGGGNTGTNDKLNQFNGMSTDSAGKEYDGNEYFTLQKTGAILYPYPLNREDLTINNSGQLYKLIKPGESITLPLVFEYCLESGDVKVDHISKTISFDVRTSLYNDPTNFKVAIKANYEDQLEEKIARATNQNYSKYNTVVIDK